MADDENPEEKKPPSGAPPGERTNTSITRGGFTRTQNTRGTGIPTRVNRTGSFKRPERTSRSAGDPSGANRTGRFDRFKKAPPEPATTDLLHDAEIPQVIGREKLQFKTWEKTLIFFSLFLFASGVVMYLTGISLVDVYLGLDGKSQKSPIGHLQIKTGTIKRKPPDSLNFKEVEARADLFNGDTIMTDLDSSGMVKLKDGGEIRLSSNTMIKLALQSGISFTGIKRQASVDLISGQVSGLAADSQLILRNNGKEIMLSAGQSIEQLKNLGVLAPKSEENLIKKRDPPKVSLLYPSDQAGFHIDRFAQVYEKTVSLKWNVTPPPQQKRVQLILKKTSSDPKEPTKELVSHYVDQTGVNGFSDVTVYAVGRYDWEVIVPDDEIKPNPSRKGSFFVRPDYIGLDGLESYIGVDDDHRVRMMLRWKDLQLAEYYLVQFFKEPRGNPVSEFKVAGTKTDLSLRDLFKKLQPKNAYYNVKAYLKNGFIARSEPIPMDFSVLRTRMASPADGQSLSDSDFSKAAGKLILTWEKSPYSTDFEVQIAHDQSFRQIVQSRSTRENVVVFDRPGAGDYYWKVLMRIEGIAWGPAAPFHFRIERPR